MRNVLGEIVDTLPGLVWGAGPDGGLEFVNARWIEYTGISPEKTAGDAWESVVHPADLATFQTRWRAIRTSGTPGEMEARLRRLDGAYRRFLISTSPVLDAQGEITRWYGINTDIQERRGVEEALRSSQDQLESVVDGLPALVSFMTPAGRLERANRPYLDYYGAGIEELRELDVLHGVHPQDRGRIRSVHDTSLQSGKPYEVQARCLGTDGVCRWFQLRASPLRDLQGRIVLWQLLQMDIHDQKETQFLLNGEKRLLEMVATGQTTASILEALCQLVEETAAGCYCSVVLIDPTGTRLEHGAAPSLPESFISSIMGRAVNADSGPCAMAAYLNQQVISSDLATETRWQADSWCSMALAHGIRSCWSTPIASAAGTVLGAFAIYYDEPRTPTPQIQSLIDQFAHIASIALERERAQTSLTQALGERERSERQLRTMIDTIPGYVWRTTPEGTVDFLNQGWCDYTGVSMPEALQRGWEQSVHPDDYPGVMEYWRTPLETGTPGEYECRHRRYDGTYRWFVGRAVPLRDQDGAIVKWYGLNTDIEDRKRAELLIEGKNRLLEMVAARVPLNDILVDLCRLVESTMMGSFCSTMLVDPDRDTFHGAAASSLSADFVAAVQSMPLDSEAGPCAMAACLRHQVVVSELTLDARWQDQLWYQLAMKAGLKSCWSTPVVSTAGQVLAVFAVYYRDTKVPTPFEEHLIRQFAHIASIAIERIQSDAALKRSEAFLAKAQRLSSSGSFSWRVSTDDLMFSAEFYRIFGLDPAQPVSVPMVMSRVHPEDAPAFTRMIERARTEGADFDDEHRLVMTDGSVKYIYMVAHRTVDADGESVYIGAVQDVTRRRLSEDALGNSRSELARVARVTSLGALTASIAHEVNQPLFGITTNASTCVRMLGSAAPNLEGAREMARRIIRDGNRASEVITRLRAMFVKREPTSESVDLNEVTQEVIALSIGELQRSKVVLQTDLAADLPCVMGDRVQLQQVILNLCLNAADAMSAIEERPRQLVITTGREADMACLSVQDAGVGFEPETAEKLFDAFFTTKRGGMGIGLSVSRSIIESHHGRLWAARNDGPGATFAFAIPLNPRLAAAGPSMVRPASELRTT
jgi:PAS domain S-box-containing protein